MSNFGQGFQNAGFDPSLLYGNMGGAGGSSNMSNVGSNMGNAGGMNLGDQQKVGQNQPFNLASLGGMGAGGLGGNMGTGNASNSSLPPGWLNQFASLQSQASQHLNPNAQGGAGQGLNAQNLGMLNNDGQQRQMEIVSDEFPLELTAQLRSMQATRLTNNGIPNASPQQNQQTNNLLAQQLFAQRQQQTSAAAGQQQNAVAGQQQRPQIGAQQPNLQNKVRSLCRREERC